MSKLLNVSTSKIALPSALMVALLFAAHAANAATAPSILVLDQKAENGEIVIEYAYLPADGYIVLYGVDKSGNAVRVAVGHASLKAGSHVKVPVKMDAAAASGSEMWATLYADKDQKPGFDKTADASIWNNALPLANKFVVR